MFGFASKIYCVLKDKKVKTKTAKDCLDFSLIPIEGEDGAMFAVNTLFNDKYVPTCDHCYYNDKVGCHPPKN